MEKLGEYLDRLLRQKNLNPKELSRRSGLTDSYIGRVCKGQSNNLTVNTIRKLATALDVNPHEIFAVAAGILISETAPIDPHFLLDQVVKLLADADGLAIVRQLLDFSDAERKTLLAYIEYFKRPPAEGNGTSRRKSKPRKK